MIDFLTERLCLKKRVLVLTFVVLRMTDVSGVSAGLSWDAQQAVIHAEFSDTEATATFKAMNESEESISIVSVTSSCDCTVAKLSRTEIEPAKSQEIKMSFTFGDRKGKQQKHLSVRTTDPEQPLAVLTMTVFIPELAEIKPTLLYWRRGESPQTKEFRVKLLAPDVEVTEVISNNPAVRCEVQKGDADDYVVKVIPQNTQERLSAVIAVKVKTAGVGSRTYSAHVRVK